MGLNFCCPVYLDFTFISYFVLPHNSKHRIRLIGTVALLKPIIPETVYLFFYLLLAQARFPEAW